MNTASEHGEEASSAFDRFVMAPLDELWARVVEHAPAVATAVVVLLALWIAAKLIRSLHAVRESLESVLGYLPSLLSALLILTIGGYIAGIARRAVAAVFVEVRNPYSRLLEGLTEFVLLVVVCTLAINVLGVDMSIITQNLTILTSVVALTIAFLFAWSMREPASDIIANYYLRRMVGIGDAVSVGAHAGVVAGFTALGIQVRDETGRDYFWSARQVLPQLQRSARATPSSLQRLGRTGPKM